MARSRAHTLLESTWWIERFTLQRAWADLTDDELFWEPVPGAWGVRRRSECRTRHPFGEGDWVVDFDVDVAGADNEPMTTIGWLFWHMASMPERLTEIDFLGGSHEMASGWTSPYLTHHPAFTSATEAVDRMRHGWDALLEAIRSADDDRLEIKAAGYTYAPAPPERGLLALGPPGPELPASFFIAGTLNEVSHHGSQICTLRDLYGASNR
jgi:hypothetical protein